MRKSIYKTVHGTSKGFKFSNKTRTWRCKCSRCYSHYRYRMGNIRANEMIIEEGYMPSRRRGVGNLKK